SGVFVSSPCRRTGWGGRWWRRRARLGGGWRRPAVINGIGAATTAVVLGVLTWTKFIHGAWVVVILIPLMVLAFFKIHRHYQGVATELTMEQYEPVATPHQTVVVMAPDVHVGVMRAVEYARGLSSDVRAVHVAVDPARARKVEEKWRPWVPDIPLCVLRSDYRALVDPMLRYLRAVKDERDDDVVTLVIPEFVTRGWTKLLHNHNGLLLKFALLFERDVVVANVRYYLGSNGADRSNGGHRH